MNLSALPRTLLAALAGLLVLAAPARSEARAFGPAEVLTYDCELMGLTVGKGQVMVGSATTVGSQTVWPIMGLAKTDPLFLIYPMKDKFVTWYSPQTRRSIGNDLNAEEKGKRRHEKARFDAAGTKASVTREKEGAAKEEDSYDTEPGAQDILAAFFSIRELPLKVGDKIEQPIFTGRKSFTLRATVDGKQQTTVPAGTFDTVLLKVQVQFSAKLESKRDILVYVTDDERHIPLKIDAEFMLGAAALNLTSYQRGMNQ